MKTVLFIYLDKGAGQGECLFSKIHVSGDGEYPARISANSVTCLGVFSENAQYETTRGILIKEHICTRSHWFPCIVTELIMLKLLHESVSYKLREREMKKAVCIKVVLGLFLFFTVSPGRIFLAVPLDRITVQRHTDRVIFNNADYMAGEIGDPALPCFSRTILLPPDVNPTTVTVSVVDKAEEVIPGTFDLTPKKPYTTSMGVVYSRGDTALREGKNRTVYSTNAFFPSRHARISATGRMHAYNLVTVEIVPYTYNPVSKTLRHLTAGRIQVDYRRTGARQSNPIPSWIASQAKHVAVNFDKMSRLYIHNNNPTETMVVITSNSVVNGSSSLQAFVDSKKKKGFDISVITEDTWGGTGMDKADDIRNWLVDNYQSKNIKYVLLIGDPTPNGVGDVPMKIALPQGTPIGSDCPTDYYFAELTGNWDLNGNSWVGEKDWDLGEGGCDKFSEVFVGRIPVYSNNYSTLDRILYKIIAYENASPESAEWRKNILLPVEPSDFMTPGYQYCEAVKKDFADPNAWGSFRIYKESYPDAQPDASPTSVSTVTNTWTTQKFGICDWNTHGNETEAIQIMNSSTTQQLNDTYPSLVFQGSCLNAKPELSSNLAYSMLKNGAIGTIAATRLSLYEMGQTDPTIKKMTNISICYYFAEFCIIDEDPLGVVLARLKNEIDGDFKGLWLNYCDYNLYGDPSIGIASMDDQVTELKTDNAVVQPIQITQHADAVHFSVPATECRSLGLTLYTLQGRKIYTHRVQNTAGQVSFSWNKKTASGRSISQGIYLCVMTVTDTGGITSSRRQRLTLF